MHYSTLFLLAFLPLSFAAIFKRDDAAPANTAFRIIAAHSASSIHLLPVNAANNAFFIGIGPSTYCPQPPIEDCPAGTSTTLLVAYGTCSLDVEVPGGQQVYVLPNGALGFTTAHTSVIPDGAVTTAFTQTPSSDPYALGHFTFSGLGSTGFVACPVADSNGPYQVYAQVTGFVPPNSNPCISFNALTSDMAERGAWEYV